MQRRQANGPYHGREPFTEARHRDQVAAAVVLQAATILRIPVHDLRARLTVPVAAYPYTYPYRSPDLMRVLLAAAEVLRVPVMALEEVARQYHADFERVVLNGPTRSRFYFFGQEPPDDPHIQFRTPHHTTHRR